MTQPDEKAKEQPVWKVEHDEFAKPRMVSGRNHRAARATIAKELRVTKIGPREAYDLTRQGVEMVVAGKSGG